MTQPLPSRVPTPIDRIAEEWVQTLTRLDPAVAIWIGLPGDHSGYADYSPEGHETLALEASRALAVLRDTDPVDDVDRVTRTDLAASLELQLESFDAGLHRRDLNVIASPAQGIREVFDLMPTATAEDWEVIARKLRELPDALEGYTTTLRSGIESGATPARRQAREVLAQAVKHAAPSGFFGSLANGAVLASGDPLPPVLQSELADAATAAAEAYGRFGVFLDVELTPAARDDDAVGRELYELHSRSFLGATIDLDETYEWGVHELERMTAEQLAIAREIVPGGSVADAIAALDADPARRLQGTAALRDWMQRLSDDAVESLGREHFDIPEPVRRLECMIAPTTDGGIYYTSPSDDFSRPGRMWWSVPEGVTEFSTWRETTTVYHEGVPGHHLQLGQAVYNRALLNTWRRQLAGTSGHAEGWALYAERLVHELGFLDDPGDRLGMLDAQRMRAARVVLDIGVHLRKPRLDGSGVWDHDYALEFLRANVNMDDAFVRFEVNRYLGWPGQAPSYKVGQRIWEGLRDEVRAVEGADFSLKRFHRRALDLGGVGLDTLASELTRRV